MASSSSNTSNNDMFLRIPTPVEPVGAPHSRIPIRSTSLPSLKHRFRRSISLQSPRKSIADAPPPLTQHATVPKYSHSKSLSDYIPHLPKRMSLTLGSGLFPSRSKVQPPDLRRRHTGSVFYEDDGLAESDSELEEDSRLDPPYLPSCYHMPDLSVEELDVHIPETSLWEEIQFPEFEDEENSRVDPFSIMPDAKPIAVSSPKEMQHEAEPQAVLAVASVEEDPEWTDVEKEDVNWMRELLLGNLTI